LSYWIKKKSCIGGACITASHNPGEYSGIKVYAATGGQVVHPEDKEIMRAIDSVEESFVPAAFEGSIDYLEADDDRAYIEDVATTLPMSPQKPGFDVAFTALHGCAGSLFQKFYRHLFQSELHIVEEQFLPDGDFPTVVQPNPEIPSTMHMVEKLGREKNCEIVLATDGDGDRIGFAEWDSAKNKYWYPTGNEILVLLTDFLLSERKQKSELDYCLKTIVSTELTDSVAKHHGASCRSTLTGFKWIADYVENNPELSFVCGGEESFGFLFGRYVSDKDGMSSLALIVQLKAWCRDQGMSIHGKMEAIYARHGYFLDRVDSRVFKSAESLGQVKQGLESLRKNPPQLVAGYKVEKIWDLQNDQYGPCEMTANPRGFSLSASLNMPAANVLQFYLANGSKISVRPSGTEPKMKVYYSLPAAIAKGDRGALTEKFVEIQSHVWSLLGDSRDDSQGVDS
jgi:phosphoglucomutase